MLYDIFGNSELDYEKVIPNSIRWLDLKDLPNEIWKDIEGYEGLYQVSNYGRVKRLEQIKEYMGNNQYNKSFNICYKVPNLILKLKEDKYLRVCLTDKNKQQDYLSVHRLVAKAFISNPNNLSDVDHIDTNTYNNCLFNLQWVTCSQNSKLSWERGRKKLCGKHHHNSKIIGQYTLSGKLIKKYYGSGEASRATNISDVNIRKCCRGDYGCKTSGGYIWKYI